MGELEAIELQAIKTRDAIRDLTNTVEAAALAVIAVNLQSLPTAPTDKLMDAAEAFINSATAHCIVSRKETRRRLREQGLGTET